MVHGAGKNKSLDDYEGVFKKICHFILAKCHKKLNHAIYIVELVDRLNFDSKALFRSAI